VYPVRKATLLDSGRLDRVPYLGLLLVSPILIERYNHLERPVQRGFGDLEGLANLHDGVFLLVEILGNTEVSCGQGFGSAAFFASGSGSSQPSLCPLPN
jgi:hypothetical protein